MKYIILLLLIIPIAHGLEISEVMYNPIGNDNNLEYVEVYSEDEINLSEYIFEDSSSSDTLHLLQFMDSRYYLIVEDGFNYSGLNASVYGAGASLGNNLNNNADVVLIRDSLGNVADVLSYTSDLGGNGNGMALCANVTIVECVPTPGADNYFNNTSPPDNTTNTSSSSNIDYHIIINEVLPNPNGLDSDNMPDGEWIELFNEGDGVDVNGLEICDKDWNCLTISSNKTLKGTFASSNDYIVVYMNGKSLLNNAGKEYVRLVSEGSIIDEMDYEGSEESNSWSLIDEEWVLTKPTPGSKNRKIENQNSLPLLNTSKMVIKKISSGNDNITNFGDTIDVRLWVYKGDTGQQKILLEIENMSAKIQFNVIEKYREYEVILPLMIPENCDEKYPEGKYYLSIKGLGLFMRDSILINKSRSCQKEKTFTLLSHEQATESIINDSSWSQDKITGQAAYKPKEEKIKEYGLYGFILLAVMIFGYFILQR